MKRLPEGFEHCLDDVVAVAASPRINVETDTRLGRQPVEKLPQERQVEGPRLRLGQADTPHEGWPAAHVHGDPGQRLIHRDDLMSEPSHLAALGEDGGEGLAEDKADIFDKVVCINLQVTLGADIEKKPAVKGHAAEEVVEERQAGPHLPTGAGVWIQGD